MASWFWNFCRGLMMIPHCRITQYCNQSLLQAWVHLQQCDKTDPECDPTVQESYPTFTPIARQGVMVIIGLKIFLQETKIFIGCCWPLSSPWLKVSHQLCRFTLCFNDNRTELLINYTIVFNILDIILYRNLIDNQLTVILIWVEAHKIVYSGCIGLHNSSRYIWSRVPAVLFVATQDGATTPTMAL